MATYSAIQDWVKGKYGFVPKTCWIAHVKEISGLNPRIAPNRVSAKIRIHPCPRDKIGPIKEALRFFNMI